MKNIAVVVQRYGIEVNGGAEFHARILSEQLAKTYNVEILTSTALDYHGWDNYYKQGLHEVNGISVRRFPTIKLPGRKTRIARRAILQRKKYFKILKFLGIFDSIDLNFKISSVTNKNIHDWIEGQGPYMPDLVKHISDHKDDYDVFIFFTYLYYPTVRGMPLVGEKSIFIPTAHDEPLLYTKPYEHIFQVPKFIMYNTESEKLLVEKIFKGISPNANVAGVGITPCARNLETLPQNIIPKKYFIYIGRIDSAKGCDQMVSYFIEFIKKNPKYSEYKLVLVGKNFMKRSSSNSSVIYTGFISEELKNTYLVNSLAMIMPSLYESLSLVTLEAMAVGKSVIVNHNCEVLRNHIIESGVGASYSTRQEFADKLIDYIEKNANDLEVEGGLAKKYVSENYSWATVLQKFHNAINFVTAKSGDPL